MTLTFSWVGRDGQQRHSACQRVVSVTEQHKAGEGVLGRGVGNITQDGHRKPFEEGERRLKGSYRVSHRDKEEKQREQVQGQCGDGLAGLFQE